MTYDDAQREHREFLPSKDYVSGIQRHMPAFAIAFVGFLETR